jgi:ureidoglycolate lyase
MALEKLRLQPLTRETFAPYGDVIEYEGRDFYHINDGMVERYHHLAKVDVCEEGGRPLISIMRAKPYAFPLTVKFVEHHPWSSQAFIPTDDNPFLVVVAKPGDTVRPDDLRAFVTNGKQGVNYHRAVWHHVLLVPHRPMQFIVVDRGGPGKNCIEFWFEENDQRLLEL